MHCIQTRTDLISTFPKNSIMAEIGVFQGSFSKVINTLLTPKELHLIDVFKGTICSGDKDGNNLIWANLDHEFNVLKIFFKDMKSVKLHKGKSEEILKTFSNDYFDVIYIDGDHSYEGAMNDLKLAKEKIKIGGIISGHDYTSKVPGVFNAVNDFIAQNNLKIDFITLDKFPSFGIINNKWWNSIILGAGAFLFYKPPKIIE